ncbi:hypothetical protein BJ999_003533 [Actinomadura citrea]|uniref:Uncharacterized protein n=2 Tax=Actinomadura citrea TaxID=46158 RepID=A0A7Y9KBS0_9ACTN|nr:hypothetical protein [Actinomadura citrea]
MTKQPTRFRVTTMGMYVLVTTRAGIGSTLTGKPAPCPFSPGMIPPDDVPAEQIRHLVDSGMVEDIGPALAED